MLPCLLLWRAKENVLLALAHIKNVRTGCFFAISHKPNVTINGQEAQPEDLRQNKWVHCGRWRQSRHELKLNPVRGGKFETYWQYQVAPDLKCVYEVFLLFIESLCVNIVQLWTIQSSPFAELLFNMRQMFWPQETCELTAYKSIHSAPASTRTANQQMSLKPFCAQTCSLILS